MNSAHIARSAISNTYGSQIAWNNHETQTTFISVNTFWGGHRQISNIYSIEALYVDLDIYNIAEIWNHIGNIHDNNFLKNGNNKEEVLKIQHDYIINLINQVCLLNNIPTPTTINFSGRGYNIFWELKGKDGFSGIHGSCLNVWKLVNTELVALFKCLGADSAANDLTRVFKKMGQINHKSGFSATTVYNNTNKYDFKIFSNTLLKYTHEQTIEYKKKTASPKQIKFIKDLSTELNIKVNLKEDLTKEQANQLIKELKAKKPNRYFFNTNSNATLNTLNNQLKLGNIKDGNRSVFLHRYAIGLKLNNTPKGEAKTIIINLAQKLNFSEKEAILCFDQGYNHSNCKTGLNTKKLLVDLGITTPSSTTVAKEAKKQSRTSDKQLNYKTLRHIILMNNDMALSARKIATKYGIGKTKAAELLNYMRANKSRLNERKIVSVNFLETQNSANLKVFLSNYGAYSSLCHERLAAIDIVFDELVLYPPDSFHIPDIHLVVLKVPFHTKVDLKHIF